MHPRSPTRLSARFLLPALLSGGVLGMAHAVTVVEVPGTTDPWRAPVVVDLPAALPQTLDFQADGIVSNNPFPSLPCCPLSDPDGGDYLLPYDGDGPGGLAALRAPINALVGVFVGPPGGPVATPASLDYATLDRDAPVFAPQLYQPFVLGDGRDASGVSQRFVVPEGAASLWLGTMDDEYYNNIGRFSVAFETPGITPAVPEPGAAALLLVGLLGVGVGARRLR